MGGPSADPGEKRGPRKDVERCISRALITPAPVEQRFRLKSVTSGLFSVGCRMIAHDPLKVAAHRAVKN